MVDSNTNHLPGAPLPNSVVELQARRLTPFKRLLNDMVEELHTKCYESEKYRSYHEAVWDEQAVEGSLATDNIMAAGMIRDRAIKENSPVAREKLHTINKSLGVVLRRYGLSRKERRQTVDGQIVPNGDE
jgi:hypothetical protein